MDKLRKYHNRLINDTDLSNYRYNMDSLPWSEKLLGIKGLRGIGKTTLLLQFIKKQYGLSDKALYVSLDDLYFTENKLIDLVEDFTALGGEHLFVDEVHKYPNWSIELKNIYDYYKNLKVVFTGSSLLEILNSRSDLSRRALVFQMKGMSFREYINFYYNTQFDVITLEDIIENHVELAFAIGSKIKPLKYFPEYLKQGYFPFYDGNAENYRRRLQEILNMIIEIELPMLRNTNVSIIPKIKQLLYIIAMNVPFQPNISALASKISVTRTTILEYLNYLSDAQVLSSIYKKSVGVSLLQKPDKLYLENTNYSYAIGFIKPNMGNLRETFFQNQLSESHKVNIAEKGDFIIDQKYTFEIGGKSKDYSQIANLENSYIAADNMEFGIGNKIPLWLFGFLY